MDLVAKIRLIVNQDKPFLLEKRECLKLETNICKSIQIMLKNILRLMAKGKTRRVNEYSWLRQEKKRKQNQNEVHMEHLFSVIVHVFSYI